MSVDSPGSAAAQDAARTVEGDHLTAILHDADESVVRAALENPHLHESHVCLVLERLDLPVPLLEAIGSNPQWLRSEAIRLRLARHPHTPQRIAVPLVRQLFLFDLVTLSMLPSAPSEVRRLAQEAILAKIPQLPLGQKLTLARRGPARVAAALILEGHPRASVDALKNPYLTESQVLRVLASRAVTEPVVAAIARDPKWSAQKNVRFGLLRAASELSPQIEAFLGDFTLSELAEVVSLEEIASPIRIAVRQEIAKRKL
ncbi:MAG: hypothetical protein WB869_05770 [Candidatus Acidiferrales bacterium]